jgi:uncharacterized protein (DUF302 family)
MAADGLITVPSSFGPQETMAKLEAEVKAKGLTVFAHVDHAAGAATVGLSLLPTDLLIFGNAKGGTPLMQAAQTVGIDLPLKVLVWQDAFGQDLRVVQRPRLDRGAARARTRGRGDGQGFEWCAGGHHRGGDQAALGNTSEATKLPG